MARSVRLAPNARRLRRLITVSFTADEVCVAVCILADLPLPQPFLFLHQGVTSVLILMLLGVVSVLWLAVWVTALRIAAQRRDGDWLRVFVGIGVFCVAAVLALAYMNDLLPFPATFSVILFLGNGYLFVDLFVLFIVVVCPLPVPIVARRYAEALATIGA